MVYEDLESDGLWNYTTIQDETVIKSERLDGSSCSISFWIRPKDNFVGSSILFFGSEDEYIELSSRGLNEEVFSGLTLSSKHGDSYDWLVAEGDKALHTRKWNYVTLNFQKKKAELYLNGARIAEGSFNHEIKNTNLCIGSNPLGNPDMHGRISSLAISAEVKGEEAIQNEYHSRLAAVLLDTVEYPDQDHLARDLWFMDETIEGYPLTWTVEENPVMKATGQLTDYETEADIHARASLETEYGRAEKEFIFHTAGTSDETLFHNDLKAMDADISGVIHSHTRLPLSEKNGMTISWQVQGNAAIDEEGTLIKTSDQESEKITLTARCSNGSLSVEKSYDITLLDKAYAYVLAYFNESAETEEGYLAVSLDGLDWTKLNDFSIKAPEGRGGIRDPQVSRAKDGSFLIAATESGDHPFAYLFQSDDLVTFQEPARILLSYPDKGLGLSGGKSWAPEIYYDNEADLYYVYYSDPNDDNGSIYYVTVTPEEIENRTTKTSYPSELLHTGYTVIDGTIFTMNGKYWMIYKDEREAAQTIYSSFTDDLRDTFRTCYDWQYLLLPRPVEGPLVFKDIHSDEYHIYVDHFSNHTLFAGRFTSLGYDHLIDWSDTKKLHLPETEVRHGSVLSITQKEYERLAGMD